MSFRAGTPPKSFAAVPYPLPEGDDAAVSRIGAMVSVGHHTDFVGLPPRWNVGVALSPGRGARP